MKGYHLIIVLIVSIFSGCGNEVSTTTKDASTTITMAILDGTWIEECQFGEGTMLPKIYAAIYFLEHHGQKVIISSFKKIKEAIAGTAGTIITKGK